MSEKYKPYFVLDFACLSSFLRLKPFPKSERKAANTFGENNLNMKNFALILSTFALFTCFQAQAITFKENILFTSTLEGGQMVPTVNTPATGLGSFMLNRKRDSISINISLRGLSATQVAIYHGKEGSNGTLLFDLSGFLDGNIIRTKLNGSAVISNLSKWMSNDL